MIDGVDNLYLDNGKWDGMINEKFTRTNFIHIQYLCLILETNLLSTQDLLLLLNNKKLSINLLLRFCKVFENYIPTKFTLNFLTDLNKLKSSFFINFLIYI